ncbi:UNKNOWN [Stylonychia lemnae]|uniref:C2H2-type domain-containing protein n=1 Tax=Stylonychia lemnae TaxID=5949 RepID=A0A078AJ22_STYLE|nr:UNKNOWN [Stylonychia lemnae]|eukprot:CDW81467.1 UNKNOWN [Stylonychia lemnae]
MQCDKDFSTIGNLRDHERRHFKIKHYQLTKHLQKRHSNQLIDENTMTLKLSSGIDFQQSNINKVQYFDDQIEKSFTFLEYEASNEPKFNEQQLHQEDPQSSQQIMSKLFKDEVDCYLASYQGRSIDLFPEDQQSNEKADDIQDQTIQQIQPQELGFKSLE